MHRIARTPALVAIAALVSVIATVGTACDDSADGPTATPTTTQTTEAGATTGSTATSDSDPKTAEGLGDRLVVASGPLTEIVYALGHGDRIAAVDTSSIYPAETDDLPKIGFFRKLSAEPILAVEPSAILLSSSAGPESTLERLEDTGVKIVKLEEPEDFDDAAAQIRKIAELLGTPERAGPLVERLRKDVAEAEKDAAELHGKALFIYARGPNVLMVSGGDTSAHDMMERAGLTNAAAELEGFKPMTPEAVVAANPDLLVMTTKGAGSVGGWDGIARLPGVAETPAGTAKRLVTVDDLAFLSFGPRSGKALLDLQRDARKAME